MRIDRTQELFGVLREIRKNQIAPDGTAPDDDIEQIEQVQTLMRDGTVNVGSLDTHGVSLFKRLASLPSDTVRHLFKAVIEADVNVLDGGDNDIDYLFNECGADLTIVGLIGRHEDRGFPMRDARGGNLFHHMALLPYKFNSYLAWLRAEDVQYPGVWANELCDGATPLHLFTEQALALNPSKKSEDQLPRITPLIAEAFMALEARGADLLLPNAQGVSAWEMIRDVQVGDLSNLGVGKHWTSFCARIEMAVLERETEPAPARNKTPGRL